MKAITEKRKKDEEARKIVEHKRAEAQENNEKLLVELGQLAELAEESSKSLEEAAKPFEAGEGDKLTGESKVANVVKVVEEAGAAARHRLAACNDFLKGRGAELGKRLPLAPPQPSKGEQKEAEANKRPAFPELTRRISECTRSVENKLASCKVAQAMVIKKLKANATVNKMQAVFKKHDKDKDGQLSRKEVLQYAKAEFGFVIPTANLDAIFGVLVLDGGKGVEKADFQRLKVMVGILREVGRDQERRAEREEKEK